MSDTPSPSEHHAADESANVPPVTLQTSKRQRPLACVLCQQRKVKCDRKFPCATCVKARVQCVPATLTKRRRRRRFPERELLDRLHRYESLLRQNNIIFDPLHKDSAGDREPMEVEGNHDSGEEYPESAHSTTVKSERGNEAKNIWHAMSQRFRDPGNESDSSNDDIRETIVKRALSQLAKNDDHLLFGSRTTAVDLSTLHPDPIHIFRLWQTYLDNVNPLLKVTHTPTLQARIIEAAGKVANVDPTLEALMFGIYCMSTLSLSNEECQSIFGSSQVDLLSRYRFGCQQALMKCQFLRSSDRDCLTALFLYLVSVEPSTTPPSLSSMLGVAFRIAQRMGIHNESSLTKCGIFEAEMSRRLWWALVLFDTRISELANSTNLPLNPTWDCRIPLNVNDSDLRPDMKEPPADHGKSTEALFAVVRSELGDFVRHKSFYLDFSHPALKPLTKISPGVSTPDNIDLMKFEEVVEDKYFKFCDPDNRVHFVTMWLTRTHLAKFRLLEHLSRFSEPSLRQTDAQRDDITSHALKMLECDTKVMKSPLTKGFLWLNHWYFPFIAYIQILQELRRRPTTEHARNAWQIMSDNYDSWFDATKGPLFHVFADIVLQAWSACELEFSKHSAEPVTQPGIVLTIRNCLVQTSNEVSGTDQTDAMMGLGIDDFINDFSMPTNNIDQSMSYNMGLQHEYTGHNAMSGHMSHFSWPAMGGWHGWRQLPY